MKMFNGAERLRRAIQRIDAVPNVEETTKGESIQPVEQKRNIVAKKYTVVKLDAGVEKQIAFGLNAIEADVVAQLARRKMIKATDPSNDGNSYFAVSEIVVREEI